MFDFLRKYSLPLFSLFLIAWSIWQMTKDKQEKKQVIKKVFFSSSIFNNADCNIHDILFRKG